MTVDEQTGEIDPDTIDALRAADARISQLDRQIADRQDELKHLKTSRERAVTDLRELARGEGRLPL